MFCGVVVDTVEGDLAMIVVGVISLFVLVPMFIFLLLYIFDPRSVARCSSVALSMAFLLTVTN